jgi:hypothetical protein
VVVVPTDEIYKERCGAQEAAGCKDIPDEAIMEMKGRVQVGVVVDWLGPSRGIGSSTLNAKLTKGGRQKVKVSSLIYLENAALASFNSCSPCKGQI